METEAVPDALRKRLGAEATAGLLHVLEAGHREGREDVIAACTERFERRLVAEISGVRVQLAQVEAALQSEIRRVDSALRQEMTEMGASLRLEMSAGRVELLKWCFIFWIGQVVAIAGIVGVMLRVFRV